MAELVLHWEMGSDDLQTGKHGQAGGVGLLWCAELSRLFLDQMICNFAERVAKSAVKK